MKKRKIEKQIFSILKLLPLLMILVYFALNFASSWSTGTNIVNSTILTNFNEIMANFSVVTEVATPIQYFLEEIFGLNTVLTLSISYYLVWLIITELLWIIYDVIIFLPRIMRSMIEKGMDQS